MRRRYKLQGHRWARVRRAALVRDNFQCVKCGRAGRMEVDHVLPRHKGGALYDLGNLQTLCYQCHLAKTSSEFKKIPDRPGYREKWRAMIDML